MSSTSAEPTYRMRSDHPQSIADIDPRMCPMDQLRASSAAGVEPAVIEILDRTRSLTGDELVVPAAADAEALR